MVALIYDYWLTKKILDLKVIASMKQSTIVFFFSKTSNARIDLGDEKPMWTVNDEQLIKVMIR